MNVLHIAGPITGGCLVSQEEMRLYPYGCGAGHSLYGATPSEMPNHRGACGLGRYPRGNRGTACLSHSGFYYLGRTVIIVRFLSLDMSHMSPNAHSYRVSPRCPPDPAGTGVLETSAHYAFSGAVR